MIKLTESERLALIKHSTGEQSRAFPLSIKVGLFSSVSGLNGGSLINEITTTPTRQSIAFLAGVNTNSVTFPSLPESTPTHFALFDNLNKMIWYGDVDNPIAVSENGTFQIAVGAVSLVFPIISTGALSAYGRGRALKHLTGEQSWALPSSLFVDLHTTFAGLDSGTDSRPAYAEYQSQSVVFSSGKNAVAVQFNVAESDWDAINAVSVRDGAGNLLWIKQLQSALSILSGSRAIIPTNNINLEVQ